MNETRQKVVRTVLWTSANYVAMQRNKVMKTLDEYLNYDMLAYGAVRVFRDSCKLSLLIAFRR